ncbi:MAG: hypothetical protein A2W00_02270 [Candidatus Eisenbacteria bacterium RBG_16_71_46]|nr:MAG: hypothetical protein A2W00_02270 [Candidatus Eisenbacteria bacterium RBG_16_71_46]OGF23019.1 MAG: hypothetical protein A2V63_02675 [Candidatus Eisenbacteria bacterium RBG_19FT_COMBO_70_11]
MSNVPREGVTGLIRGTQREEVVWWRYRASAIKRSPLSTRARKERRRRIWRRMVLITGVITTAAALWVWAWPSIAGRP